jgi:hypothetical protein
MQDPETPLFEWRFVRLCARQGALTWGWKSPTHPARGSVS